jgi:predicted phosphohydrolase
MRVFAIGDLHLSASGEKPMDIFGPEWRDHRDRIGENWSAAVAPEDIVLLCGDLSWAMTLEEALPDLRFIDSLPGTKYFIRGNHDFWFSGPARVRQAVGASMKLIRFGAAEDGRVGICGVRGWLAPGHPEYDAERDDKIWRREILRLDLSLAALRDLQWDVAVAMFHFPPRTPEAETEMCDMIRDAGVRYSVYGHLHGEGAEDAFDGEEAGVAFRCVSADHIDFTPAMLFEHDA